MRDPGGRRTEDLWARWDKRVRDSILFLVGILGVVHELFIVTHPRPYALIFLASLIGVPFVLSADESKRDRQQASGSDVPPTPAGPSAPGDGGGGSG